MAGGDPVGPWDDTLHRMYTRVGLDDLPAHLAETYGIDVAGTTALDSGVLRVDRRDGPPWVARVFSERRPTTAVHGDLAVLRHAEAHDLPGERPATESPVSTLHGQPVLVTEFIPTASRTRRGGFPGGLGGLAARVHTVPLPEGAAARPAGALHHFAEGTRDDEVQTALRWLDQIEPRVAPADREGLSRLREALAGADGGAGLPLAFIHPDPVPKNIIPTPEGGRLVDWTGAGVGPRVVALEYVLIWPTVIGRTISAYVDAVPLTDEEWTRLPGIAMSRRLVGLAFRFCCDPGTAPQLPTQITSARRNVTKLMALARAALDG